MANTPIIEMKKIYKSFGAVKALSGVDIFLSHQEILGLVGDNAAGKSTLLKILAGVHLPNTGEISVEGKKVKILNPKDARNLGIETIYQDFMLATNLDITANIFLGRELTGWGLMAKLKKKGMREQAKRVLGELGVDLSPLRTLVLNLSGGQQQTVAIARALLYRPQVILMDEPTASLSVRAIRAFLDLVRQLRETGKSIIYVSHRLPDVISIADRIIILRAGRLVAERKKEDTNIEEIVELMMGTKVVQ